LQGETPALVEDVALAAAAPRAPRLRASPTESEWFINNARLFGAVPAMQFSLAPLNPIGEDHEVSSGVRF
jgi:hypothetical protein